MNLSILDILKSMEMKFGFKTPIKWKAFLSITFYHIFGVYWCYHYAFPVKIETLIFAWAKFLISGFGITCGVHRLWTHRSYKARKPLEILFIIGFSSAGQNSIYQWVRDHRQHHKYSDTDADPHNSIRGLFFSHIGWLMMKKNDEVIEAGKKIDMSDIERDSMLMFQHKYRNYFNLLFCYILPVFINTCLLKEEWRCAVAWQCFIVFFCVLHAEFSVNSLAHAYGYKPYNKNIMATENLAVSVFTFGEGSHNYHHVFPFDYKSTEGLDVFNLTTSLIHMFVKLGWAYDLREPSPEMVKSVVARLSDKSF